MKDKNVTNSINQAISKAKRLQLHPDTEEIIRNAVTSFEGISTTLESAIGALIFGQFYGWRVLRIVHSSSTYNKYEKILGIKFTDICAPETDGIGPLAKWNFGYRYADKINSFWKVATGKDRPKDENPLSIKKPLDP